MRPRAVALCLAAGAAVTVLSTPLFAAQGESTGQARTATETLTAPTPITEPLAPSTPRSPTEQGALAEAVSAAVNDVVPGTEIGLVVYDRSAGRVVTSKNAEEQFYTASVVKLLIVIQVLRDAGWELPTGSEREDLVAMLARSADWVAAGLWEAHGGPAIPGEVAALAGLAGTTPPGVPDQWEMTRMSPRDVLRVYEYIDDEIPPHAREFVLTALSDATELAADGFDQSFGLPSALPGTQLAIKQGWMRIINGLVLNTTGIVGPDRRYVVVLLTRQPAGTGFPSGSAAVTAGIAALAPVLTSGPR